MKKLPPIILRLIDFIALKITKLMATMGCAGIFFIWSLVPLAFPSLQNLVFYVSGAVIQLVALPLIMVGQDLLSRASEERAIADHNAIMEEVAELREILADTREELNLLRQIATNQIVVMKQLGIT